MHLPLAVDVDGAYRDVVKRVVAQQLHRACQRSGSRATFERVSPAARQWRALLRQAATVLPYPVRVGPVRVGRVVVARGSGRGGLAEEEEEADGEGQGEGGGGERHGECHGWNFPAG